MPCEHLSEAQIEGNWRIAGDYANAAVKGRDWREVLKDGYQPSPTDIEVSFCACCGGPAQAVLVPAGAGAHYGSNVTCRVCAAAVSQ